MEITAILFYNCNVNFFLKFPDFSMTSSLTGKNVSQLSLLSSLSSASREPNGNDCLLPGVLDVCDSLFAASFLPLYTVSRVLYDIYFDKFLFLMVFRP